jgi:hypothetical protein
MRDRDRAVPVSFPQLLLAAVVIRDQTQVFETRKQYLRVPKRVGNVSVFALRVTVFGPFRTQLRDTRDTLFAVSATSNPVVRCCRPNSGESR